MEAYFRLPDGKQSFSPFDGECKEIIIFGSLLISMGAEESAVKSTIPKFWSFLHDISYVLDMTILSHGAWRPLVASSENHRRASLLAWTSCSNLELCNMCHGLGWVLWMESRSWSTWTRHLGSPGNWVTGGALRCKKEFVELNNLYILSWKSVGSVPPCCMASVEKVCSTLEWG